MAKSSNMRLISRAADILRALADHPSGMSLGQIAAATDLSRPTVQRIVAALVYEGFIAHHEAVSGFRLGAEVARIGGLVHYDVVSLCRPFLEVLRSDICETVDLTRLEGGKAVVIDQLFAVSQSGLVSVKGGALPLHASANGKAHLSRLDRTEVAAILPSPLDKLSENTVTDLEELFSQIERCRGENLFFDEEEMAVGACGLAVAVPALVSGNYSIGVALSKASFERNRNRISGALRECQLAVTKAAGRAVPD